MTGVGSSRTFNVLNPEWDGYKHSGSNFAIKIRKRMEWNDVSSDAHGNSLFFNLILIHLKIDF